MKHPEITAAATMAVLLSLFMWLTRVPTAGSEGLPVTNPTQGTVSEGQQSQPVNAGDAGAQSSTEGDGATGSTAEGSSAPAGAMDSGSTEGTGTEGTTGSEGTGTDAAGTSSEGTDAAGSDAGAEGTDAENTDAASTGTEDAAAGEGTEGATEGAAAAAGATAEGAGDAEAGKAVFASSCSGCHGANAEGGIGPALNVVADWDLAGFSATLREGKTPEGKELAPTMPRFAEGQLPEGDVANIHAFLKTL